uniref:5'-3' exonuclease domain-containing protein n=1 Tax=uncultured prokaryote TaxID=198431 RepID=A0A0H5QJJ2_9ZZZZ|nr:hypothetical protein [uncultured prokaryote]
MKKLMVLDGNSIVNRAFYGVSQNLTTREGQPTNAIFGFLNILNKLLDEEKPDALCVTFDRAAPTFRHRAFEGYKANRKGMPEELASQMPLLKDVLSAMNIPMYELDGWEADDLLGTIARLDRAAGWATAIVTGDKDALQLVTEDTTVKLVSTRMGRTTTRDMTPESFREEYGFEPRSIIDLKALMGDSSDNYPGVKGVGEKTAMALIQQYHTVDAIYAALPDIQAKPAAIKNLTAGEADARLSYDLAAIRTDAPIDFKPEDNLRQWWCLAVLGEAPPLAQAVLGGLPVRRRHKQPVGALLPLHQLLRQEDLPQRLRVGVIGEVPRALVGVDHLDHNGLGSRLGPGPGEMPQPQHQSGGQDQSGHGKSCLSVSFHDKTSCRHTRHP